MTENTPIRAGKADTHEIATIARDPHQVRVFGGVLANLDDTLTTRGGAKGLRIYDELERDTRAYAVLQKRKLAVTARPWRVFPASDRSGDKAAALLVQGQLQALGFDQVTAGLLDATLKGFAVGEVLWAIDRDQVRAREVRIRDQRRFAFTETQALRLLTRERPGEGESLPERKFIVHRFGAKDGNPYGLGLGHKLFWPVFFKRQGITFWLTFADKFGSPTAVGKYPVGATIEAQGRLLAALGAIAQDSGVIVPEGMVIQMLEANRKGSIDTYEKLVRYMDEQISECVLGGTLTTNVGAAGSHAAAEVHKSVSDELSKADADLLSETLNSTLVRWIVDFNMPGAGYPTVYRVFEEMKDLLKLSETYERLHEMGYEPRSVEQINETFGGRWERKAVPPPATARFEASDPDDEVLWFIDPGAETGPRAKHGPTGK